MPSKNYISIILPLKYFQIVIIFLQIQAEKTTGVNCSNMLIRGGIVIPQTMIAGYEPKLIDKNLLPKKLQ